MTDFEALMQEPPDGVSHGACAEEFLQAGGWSIVHLAGGGKVGSSQAGMTTHRGVNAPTEHIDLKEVRAVCTDLLGFSIEEIEGAYLNGRPSARRARLRAEIDARLLALSRSGGNMTALARVLGWEVDESRSCSKMKAALRRARAAEVEA